MYAWGVNLTSILFMNVYRIYIVIGCFPSPLCWWIWQKGGKEFRELIYACLLLFMHIWLCLIYVLSLNMYLFICYTWVKGELLWSLSLIHAYITPWVLSSSKMGRLLAQRSITLILMMINSCSYSTNDLVMFKFQNWSRS